MLRLKKSALTEKTGKLFYNNDFFSGIAFTMSQGEIVKAIKISEGMEIGQYFPKYLPRYDHRIIDIEILDPEDENDYEPFLCLNGVRFNGIALEFDGDFCTGELLFVRGWSDSQVTYYKTGCLESIELIEDGFSQIYQWHENEQLKKYEVTSRNSFSFNLVFNEDGYLSALGMEGDYFNQVKLISDKLAIPAFKNEHFIDELKTSESLSISGNSVTDRLFKRLISSGALQQTDNISLFDTSVTKEGLHLLKANSRLNKLFINSNTIKLEDVKILKSDKPDCHIELNREEVLA